jgi:hypothetical protein
MSGHVIEALLDRNLAAGTYDVSWDAVDFSPGLYVCRLTVGAYGRSSPLLVLR